MTGRKNIAGTLDHSPGRRRLQTARNQIQFAVPIPLRSPPNGSDSRPDLTPNRGRATFSSRNPSNAANCRAFGLGLSISLRDQLGGDLAQDKSNWLPSSAWVGARHVPEHGASNGQGAAKFKQGRARDYS